MSTDNEHNGTPKDAHEAAHARALGRWLDQPASVAPEGIDADVVHAIYALKPERAPAPRVTVDDILGSVAKGPLGVADHAIETPVPAERGGAEIVPFPGQDEGESSETSAASDNPASGRAHAQPRRSYRWAGGAGGVGLALVAAATLLVVVRGTWSPGEEGLPAAASEGPAAQVVERAKKAELSDQIAEAEATAGREAPDELASSGFIAPVPAPEPVLAAPEAEEARSDLDGAGLAGPLIGDELDEYAIQPAKSPARAVIPEVDAMREELNEAVSKEGAALLDESVAGIEADAPATRAYTEDDRVEDVSSVEDVKRQDAVERSVGRSTRRAAQSGEKDWAKGLDEATLASVDEQLARAEALAGSGDQAAAAKFLEDNLVAPDTVAHRLALRAAELYLQVEQGESALRVLEKARTFGRGTSAQRRQAGTLRQLAQESSGESETP